MLVNPRVAQELAGTHRQQSDGAGLDDELGVEAGHGCIGGERDSGIAAISSEAGRRASNARASRMRRGAGRSSMRPSFFGSSSTLAVVIPKLRPAAWSTSRRHREQATERCDAPATRYARKAWSWRHLYRGIEVGRTSAEAEQCAPVGPRTLASMIDSRHANASTCAVVRIHGTWRNECRYHSRDGLIRDETRQKPCLQGSVVGCWYGN